MGWGRFVVATLVVALAVGCGGEESALTAAERAELEGLLQIEVTDEIAETVCGFDTQLEAVGYLFSIGVKDRYPTGFRGEYAAGHVAHATCDDKADRWDLESFSDMIKACEAAPATDPCHAALEELNDAVLDNAG